MGGDHRDRQMDPRHLEPVLDVELVCAIGVLGRELPAAAPQLDIGEPGQRVRGQQLVALMPFLVLALEERTRLLDAPTHVEHVRDRTVRLVQQHRVADGGGEVVCPCGVRRRLGIADGAAEEGEDGERLDPERVVVELVGELERCTGVLERSGEALLEAGRPREPALDARLQRRPRLSPRAGPPRAARPPGRGPRARRGGARASARSGPMSLSASRSVDDRPGARPFSGGAMRTSCGQGSTDGARRMPSDGVSRSACSASSAATADAPRSAASVAASSSTAAICGVGRVARRARGGGRGAIGSSTIARNASVNAPALLSQVAVENRRQQRVGEANRAVLALDHVRGDRRRERVGRNPRPLQERLRRRPECRGERERVARRRGKSGEPRADELVQRLRNRERLERVDVPVENACQLQREERITARPLVDAEQRLAGERPPEAVVQEPMERADAERSHPQPLDALRIQRLLQPRRLGAIDEPSGEQHENRTARQVFAARTRARSTRTGRATGRRRLQAGSASAR